MEHPLVYLLALSVATVAFWFFVYHVCAQRTMSGDAWYMRRFAFTDMPVSPPYCWRPLLPWLARFFGFQAVSQTANVLGPLLVYGYVGGGWKGFACGAAFLGCKGITAFNVMNPEYAEGLGQCLFIGSLWSIQAGSILAIPCLILAGLCRESLGVALAAVCCATGHPMLALFPLGSVLLAYLTRREDRNNRHPLVEPTSYQTLKRWVKVKDEFCIHCAYIIQPTRGLAIALPFMWSAVDPFARHALWAAPVLWAFSLPASGSKRQLAYCFALFIPFVAACPTQWLWCLVGLCWFWPIEYGLYDEGGGQTFGYI